MVKYNSLMDISKILDDYSNDIYRGIKEKSISVAKAGATKLKQTSPKKTGKYGRGWRVKTIDGVYSTDSIIYNATNWQLTHLLEKPHLKRNGGKTTPKVHIYPVEQESIRNFETECENVIKKESN